MNTVERAIAIGLVVVAAGGAKLAYDNHGAGSSHVTLESQTTELKLGIADLVLKNPSHIADSDQTRIAEISSQVKENERILATDTRSVDLETTGGILAAAAAIGEIALVAGIVNDIPQRRRKLQAHYS